MFSVARSTAMRVRSVLHYIPYMLAMTVKNKHRRLDTIINAVAVLVALFVARLVTICTVVPIGNESENPS